MRVTSPSTPAAGTATGAGNGAVSRCSRVSSSAPRHRSAGCRLRAAPPPPPTASAATGCAAGSVDALRGDELQVGHHLHCSCASWDCTLLLS